MVPWMSDARLVFLIWFVSIAVAVALFLVFVEIRVKKNKKRAAEKRREKTPIERMKIILARDGDVKRKFEIVGKTAKDYFKEEYGMSKGLDYSELAKEFDMRGKKLEAGFCKSMFELYYSNKELTEEGVGELGDMLVEMGRKKKLSKDMSKVPDVWDRLDRVFEKYKDVVGGKLGGYVASIRENSDRRARVEAREEHELSSWVKKAIRMGYDREGVSGLLKDAKKSSTEIKRVLNAYDKEATKASGEKRSTQLYGREGGVAQRVLQKEKDRLEGMEAFSVQ